MNRKNFLKALKAYTDAFRIDPLPIVLDLPPEPENRELAEKQFTIEVLIGREESELQSVGDVFEWDILGAVYSSYTEVLYKGRNIPFFPEGPPGINEYTFKVRDLSQRKWLEEFFYKPSVLYSRVKIDSFFSFECRGLLINMHALALEDILEYNAMAYVHEVMRKLGKYRPPKVGMELAFQVSGPLVTHVKGIENE